MRHWRKPYKKIERGSILPVNNECFGVLDAFTIGIVVDRIERNGEQQLKLFRTSNIKFHEGASTIAVFHLRSCRYQSLLNSESVS